MEKFNKLEDGKIKWEHFQDESDFEDLEMGTIGAKGGYSYIVFNSYDEASKVLSRDIDKLEKDIEHFTKEMVVNTHSLDKLTNLKELIEKIADLNKSFTEVNSNKIYELHRNDPKKYEKLYNKFNESKSYIKDEVGELAKEFEKYNKYEKARKEKEFLVNQLDKSKKQLEELEKIK